MRLLNGLGLLAICATIGTLAQGDDAAAQRGPGQSAPILLFSLEGTDRYEVDVVAIGRTVALEARRGNVGALYVVRGKVSASRIDARFGKLGQIGVEFAPFDIFSGRIKNRSERCRGGGSPLEFALFRGAIEFSGEQGYTTIDARRAFGLVIDPRRKLCRRHGQAKASGASAPRTLNTHLTAISKRGGAVTSFELSRYRGRPWLSLEALRQERRGKMQIFRQATTTVGGENAFLASGPGVRPAFAFLAAPKPFSGSALFEEGPDESVGWSGSLTAWLPGAGKVGLAGPEFASSFCRRAADQRGCNPLPPVRAPLALLQGSGSQAQALGEARLSWSRYRRNSASSAGSTP